MGDAAPRAPKLVHVLIRTWMLTSKAQKGVVKSEGLRWRSKSLISSFPADPTARIGPSGVTPVDFPPCIRHRPFGIAGDRHRLPLRVWAPHRRLRCNGNLLCIGLTVPQTLLVAADEAIE